MRRHWKRRPRKRPISRELAARCSVASGKARVKHVSRTFKARIAAVAILD
jgi:hypothetical protein